MIGLIMLGSVINYLTRSTLAVAAPTVLKDLHITAQQYSWIVGAFQGAILAQPVCGYVLDVRRLNPARSRFRLLRVPRAMVPRRPRLPLTWRGAARGIVLKQLAGWVHLRRGGSSWLPPSRPH